MTATVGDTSKRDVAITLNLKWVEVVMESSKKNAQHASECVSLHVITLPCFGPLPKYFIISAAFLSNPAITQMKHVVIHAKNTSMPLYFTCMSILNLNWNDFHWNSLSHNRCPCGLQGERSINLTHTHTDTTHTHSFSYSYIPGFAFIIKRLRKYTGRLMALLWKQLIVCRIYAFRLYFNRKCVHVSL